MDTAENFFAWRVDETSDGEFVGSEQCVSKASLPHNDDGVLINVTHSSLNYKDALSASGNKGVTRNFPHTPGIDAAGTIAGTGASVLVTGYDLGMNTDGGFGECIRVPPQWIVSPNPFANAQISMVYGTAGLTAALSVYKLLTAGNAKPEDGKILVTGATGSVGCVAVELLSNLGFEVVALSGKTGLTSHFLLELGASEIVGREALAPNKRPMLKPLYAHGIDTVGGSPLAELLKQILPGGSVTCCGNVAGLTVETHVFPFILRGIQLLGVDSVEIPLELKTAMWEKLAGEWRCPKTEAMVKTIGREDLDACLKAMLEGKSSGKIVLDHGLNTGGSKL